MSSVSAGLYLLGISIEICIKLGGAKIVKSGFGKPGFQSLTIYINLSIIYESEEIRRFPDYVPLNFIILKINISQNDYIKKRN